MIIQAFRRIEKTKSVRPEFYFLVKIPSVLLRPKPGLCLLSIHIMDVICQCKNNPKEGVGALNCKRYYTERLAVLKSCLKRCLTVTLL